jgi:membrane glycosyltransferase
MAPVILGLLLCFPIAMLTSKASSPNSWLFRTPEETAPPQILVRANELASAAGEAIERPLLELRSDPRLLDAHLMNLPRDTCRNRGQINPHLAIARAKIEDAESLDEALGYLTSREEFAVLSSPSILRAVHAMPPRPQGHG